VITPDPQLAVDYGLFTVAQALSAGISYREIERGLRRGRWDRPARGILREAGREPRAGDDLLLAVLCAGPGAVAGFEGAAEVHGWDLLNPPAKPQLIVPLGYHAPKQSSRCFYRADLAASEVTTLGVLPLTTAARTALDIAATAPLEQAVVAMDSAFRSKTVMPAELQASFAMSRRHGVRQAREALALADPASGSVPETQARMLFRRAGIPAPITQHSFYEDGVFVARTDFYWPWARLVGELDGFKYHSASGDFQRDRTTQNALVRLGLRVLRFTVADLWTRENYVISRLWQGLELGGWHGNC
jgi:hypothetical protein